MDVVVLVWVGQWDEKRILKAFKSREAAEAWVCKENGWLFLPENPFNRRGEPYEFEQIGVEA